MLTLLLLIVASGNAQAATVRSLNLPDGYTISPESDDRAMSVAPDGTMYAAIHSVDGRTQPFVIRWTESADWEPFHPLYLDGSKPGQGSPPEAGPVIALFSGGALVTVHQAFSGAYLHILYEIQKWNGGGVKRWNPPSCAYRKWTGAHVYAIDPGGRIALTLDESAQAAGMDPYDPPVAIVVKQHSCEELGRAILMAINGKYVAGYRGYLDGRSASWFVNAMSQKRIAIRWTGTHGTDLGPGVPFAITRDGLAVGASALPGHGSEHAYGNMLGPAGRYEYPTPHAVAWFPNGQTIQLVRDDEESVAWDVSEDRTIVGGEILQNGKHYAFRWKKGRMQRLDDLPHPAGWRFETAYAIRADGAIVGIGTYKGVATAFVWSE